MFYAHYVLSKRGPLARIWLAAHWDKKLTKAHVFETNLEDSVETIISPQVKMALRTSGHLLLGVVRIYNRKAKYLLADCSEAFVKIKMAFRSGVVDLPEENMEAQHNQIYIVEEFPNFDTPLPDISDFDVNRHLTLNQSRIDEITMPDEAPTTMNMDEGFSGVMVDGDENYGAGVFYKENDQKADKEGGLGGFMEDGGDGGMKDGFGDGGAGGILDTSFLKGGGGLFGEPQEENFLGISTSAQKENDDMVAAIEQSEGVMDGSIMSPPPQQHQDDQNQVMLEEQEKNDENLMVIDEQQQQHMNNDNKIQSPQHQQMMEQQPEEQQQNSEEATAGNNKENNEENNNNNAAVVEEPVMKQPEATFALEPLNFTDVRDVRHRRKRKLIIDHLIELDGQTMREQLKDVDDIVTTLDMAPPTKRLMLWKEMGGVDKLFALPCQTTGDKLNKIFINNLHNTVPQDLVDVTGTQLQELFGENDEQQQQPQQQPQQPQQTSSSAHDMTESSIYGERKEGDASSIQLAPASDVSTLQGAGPGANDTNATGASNAGGVISFDEPASLIGSGNDLCMNTINRVNESDDDYDAMSNGGPPSVGDSVGAPPSPMGPMDMLLDMDLGHGGQTSMNDTTATLTSSAAATDDSNRVEVEPERLPEPEGEAFPDDLDDLRWNKRTQHLINDLDRKFRTESEVSFFRLSDGITRKQAVSKFYSLLVLAKQEATQLSQSEVFGDVYIKKGGNFESVLMK